MGTTITSFLQDDNKMIINDNNDNNDNLDNSDNFSTFGRLQSMNNHPSLSTDGRE